MSTNRATLPCGRYLHAATLALSSPHWRAYLIFVMLAGEVRSP